MKNTWLIVVVALVVVGAIWYMRSSSTSNSGPSATASPTPIVRASSTPTRVATATPVGTQKTYDQLVQQYANTRIQFDANCRATPATLSLKNGTSVLLDNRANQARTITLNGKTYNLAAYGYQVVTLTSPSLPQMLGVNCGSSVNVSTVNLQATISGQ